MALCVILCVFSPFINPQSPPVPRLQAHCSLPPLYHPPPSPSPPPPLQPARRPPTSCHPLSGPVPPALHRGVPVPISVLQSPSHRHHPLTPLPPRRHWKCPHRPFWSHLPFQVRRHRLPVLSRVQRPRPQLLVHPQALPLVHPLFLPQALSQDQPFPPA